jgi:PEP-CTERM motif
VVYNQLDSVILLIQIWVGYTDFSSVGTNAMLMKAATAALAAGTGLLGLAGLAAPASAATVLIFAQNHATPPGFVIIKDNGNGTTTLSTSIEVSVTDLAGPLVPPPLPLATFTLMAHSVTHGTTSPISPGVSLFTQEYSGSFSIDDSACGVSGVCLSGTFADAVMSGFEDGFALTLFSSTPPAAGLTFASDPAAIPASDLVLDRAMALSKTDLTFPVTNDCSSPLGCTLGTTSANVSGTFSANPMSTPEPSTWVMLMLGFAGLGFAARRSSRMKIAVID